MSAGIIICAAGMGLRFISAGGDGLKLNAKLPDGMSVFEQSLDHARASGLPVLVITHPQHESVIEICSAANVPYVTLSSPSLGDSIACGVRSRPDWLGWIIHLADMPFIGAETFRQIENALRHCPSVRPFFREIPGHPVGFSKICQPELLSLQGENGARKVLTRFAPLQLNVTTPDVLSDIDLPDHLITGQL
ncbi:nucleotidyltransferase family protein [Pantoea sp. B9002]|uniref:nucleotidyltransferase family protein n=1 Tax=Pantoea sp. B9002 TaxID=2726979 RepID=UPI0015A17582|nr:nucleotidyltransferase family protein [Pantoea sp. B9002]NWA63195.1 nucleotidyltransferase family protein [Pantoea sp. B9002]